MIAPSFGEVDFEGHGALTSMGTTKHVEGVEDAILTLTALFVSDLPWPRPEAQISLTTATTQIHAFLKHLTR